MSETNEKFSGELTGIFKKMLESVIFERYLKEGPGTVTENGDIIFMIFRQRMKIVFEGVWYNLKLEVPKKVDLEPLVLNWEDILRTEVAHILADEVIPEYLRKGSGNAREKELVLISLLSYWLGLVVMNADDKRGLEDIQRI